MFEVLKKLWVKIFTKKKKWPRLNNFYKDAKDYDSRGDNPPKRAGRNLQVLGPILFAMFFGSTVVVVTSIMSQAAFVIISNICLSVGFLITISYGIYLKFTNHKKLAATVELVLSLAIIAGLFCLAFYFTPFVSGWGLSGTLSFINLIASSINVFTALRVLVLPPILDKTQKGLIALGWVDAEIGLDFDRSIRAVPENGNKADNRARHLLSNYPTEVRSMPEWDKRAAIKPYNNAIELNSRYINKYRAALFGSIIRDDSIRERESSSNAFKNGNTDAMFRFYKTKVRDKISSTRKLYKALDNLRNGSKPYKEYFLKRDAKNKYFTKDDFIGSLIAKINIYKQEILVLLNCFPLHIALQFLIESADEFTAEEIKYYVQKISTEEQVKLYELPPEKNDSDAQEEKGNSDIALVRRNYLFKHSAEYQQRAGCDLKELLPTCTPG